LIGFVAAFGVRTRPSVALATMKILVNGESIEIQEAKTIAELIERYQFAPQSILVEHNGLAVHQHEWAERPLSEGDSIEFIRVVAGG
jgi:sulfur carrier protein